MSLLDSYFEPCQKLIDVVSDAPSVKFAKGASFSAAILFGTRGLHAQEPEEPDRARCSVTVRGDVPIGYGDLFLRKRDNMIYRVLSDPNETMTPPGASMQLQQFRAEKYGSAAEILHDAIESESGRVGRA